MWVKQIPQAAFSGLDLELLDDRRLEVRVARFTHLVVVYPLGRVDVRLQEVEQLGLQLLRAFGNVKQGHENSYGWRGVDGLVVTECRAATTPGSAAATAKPGAATL